MNFDRITKPQGIIVTAVLGLVLLVGGFWLARVTAASSTKPVAEHSRYQFLQVGDTVAAIDVTTGEAYAIDGQARAWTLLAPALPSREPKAVR